METKLAIEAAELTNEPSMNVSRTMVGRIAGNGGSGAATDFVNIISFWMEVEDVRKETLGTIDPGIVK